MDSKALNEFALRQLYVREWTNEVKSTAKSFKSWDTCMANKPCKIIAIVGIVLASIFAIYLIGGLLYFFKSGVTNISEFCCWCCACRKSSRNNAAPIGNQHQPPMVIYQPIRDPDPGYGGYAGYNGAKGNRDSTFYDERLSTKSEIDLEQSFDLEAQRNAWMNKKHSPELDPYEKKEEEIQLQTYHPTVVNTDRYQRPSPSRSPNRPRYEHGTTVQTTANNDNPFYQNTGYYPHPKDVTSQSQLNYGQSRTPFPDDDRDVPNFNRYGGY